MIENILFDLGGVLLTLDMQKTTEAFLHLGWKETEWESIAQSSQLLFKNLEVGRDNSAIFRENVRGMLHENPTDEQIDHAWNAMLIGFPEGIVNYLNELKSKYKLYLLSNTNELHLKRFREIFQNSFGYSFDSLFVKAYYSHEIGYRKPEKQAYLSVLEDASLSPENTVFVDDLKVNTESAALLGMQVLPIEAGTLMQHLPRYLERMKNE